MLKYIITFNNLLTRENDFFSLEIKNISKEKWVVENVYEKLNKKLKNLNLN